VEQITPNNNNGNEKLWREEQLKRMDMDMSVREA
jgi:hypothetical protein